MSETRLNAVVAIQSLQENPYFQARAEDLFRSVTYLSRRPDSKELAVLLEEFDVIILGVKEQLRAEMLTTAGQVRTRLIGSLSIGIDHLDVAALTAHGIQVVNTPSANVQSVAEHNLALVLSLAKRLKAGDRASGAGGGRRDLGNLPVELKGKTAGLIGYGKIGQATATLLRAFGMRVFATSPTRRAGSDAFATFTTLDGILTECTFILLALPLSAHTHELLNRHHLERLQPHQHLINTCRPGLIDNHAVLRQLKSGALGGFGADYDEDLWGLAEYENAVITPHVAGITNESVERMDNELIDRLASVISP